VNERQDESVKKTESDDVVVELDMDLASVVPEEWHSIFSSRELGNLS